MIFSKNHENISYLDETKSLLKKVRKTNHNTQQLTLKDLNTINHPALSTLRLKLVYECISYPLGIQVFQNVSG